MADMADMTAASGLATERAARPALQTEQLVATLWRRRATFILIFLVVMVTAAGITFSLPKVYTTKSYVLVSSGGEAPSDFEAIQSTQIVLKTYAELLQTRSVAILVAQALPFKMKAADLEKAVRISPVSESRLIEIKAESSTPRRAQTLANTYARVFVDRSRSSDWAGETNRITLSEPAALISTPTRPRPRLYLLVGAVLAAVVAAAGTVLRERFDERVVIDSSSTELFGLPIIARVPEQSTSVMRMLLRNGEAHTPSPALAEAFRGLLASLTFLGQEQRPKSLAVVSANEGEGKSTCCLSIGRAALDQGISVVLVDGDLRRPRLSSALIDDEKKSPGFSSLLAGAVTRPINEVAVEVPGSRLRIVPSGPPPPNATSLLAQHGLADFERRVRQLFDLVIYDSPPLAVAADGALLAAAAEGSILVVDGRRSRRGPLLQAIEQLARANANVLGVIMNRVATGRDSYYSSYHRDVAERRRGSASDASGDVNGLPPSDLAVRQGTRGHGRAS